MSDPLKRMARICSSLAKDDNSYLFREPVDWKGLQLHNYLEVRDLHPSC
jgi:hypothetical protein